MEINTRKIKDDYESYFKDLEGSITKNLKVHSMGNTPNLFRTVYPLFAMLEALNNPDYFLDPSRRIEMDQFIIGGDKEKTINAARRLFKESMNMSLELRKGISSETFTPYFDELYSDSFLLLNQYYTNNYRGCSLYLRCILEDLYRHIYYLDHRQEFHMIVNSGVTSEWGLGLRPEIMRSYLERTSYLSRLKDFNFELEKLDESTNKKNIFSLNEDLYSETSAFVHPSNPTYMNRFKSNSDLVYDDHKAQQVVRMAKQIMNMAILFLSCVHFQQVSRFNDYERSVMFIGFDKTTKGNLRRILGL